MQGNKLRVKLMLSVSLLISILASSAYGSGWQSTPASAPQKSDKQKFTPEELALIEQMQVELDGCKRVQKLTELQVTRLKEHAIALESIINLDEELFSKLKAANESRQKISTLEDERAGTFQKLIDELKTQLARAIKQRNFWRKMAAVLAAVGAVLGLLVGVAVTRQ